jgi:hypothetical protein
MVNELMLEIPGRHKQYTLIAASHLTVGSLDRLSCGGMGGQLSLVSEGGKESGCNTTTMTSHVQNQCRLQCGNIMEDIKES